MGIRERLFGSDERLSRALEVAEQRDYAPPVIRQTVDPAKIRPGATSGVDGDSWYKDVYQGGWDENPELAGRMKYLVYEEMRHDPAIRSALWMYKLPIRSATWSFEPPPEPTPMEELATEACRWQFGVEGFDGEMVQSWDQSLHQALLYLDWGSMGEEIVWGDMARFVPKRGKPEIDPVTGVEIEAPEPEPLALRTIARLAPRAPATINDVDLDRATGQIKRVRQDVPDADWIPGEKLVWYALEREGASIFGTSMLRPMYGAWKLKKGLLVSSAIAWDRWASGIPIVRYPQGGGPIKEARAEQLGAHLRVHERAYATLEGTKEMGWDVEMLTETVQDATPMLRYYDEQIAMAAQQMMKMLGGTPYGSRAGAEVVADPYYLAAVAIAHEIANERRAQVVDRFVRVNFPGDVRPPQLNVSKIQAKNVAVLAQALADLSTAGFSFADRGTQNDVRDQLDFAHLPEPTANAIDGLPDDVGVEPPSLPRPVGEGEGITAPPVPA